MIARDAVFTSFIRLVAPLVWAEDRRIAEKLLDFAATEAGSALDMFRAAELTEDPALARLFFRHALDEARHARLFEAAARALVPAAEARRWSHVHARRQNLYQRMGELRFLAFVHLAERRGEAHFSALARHFSGRPELVALLERVAKDERFHVTYSHRALVQRANGRARRLLLEERARSLWGAWRRQGRVLGDLVGRGLLALVFFTVVPPFALLLRVLEPERAGWRKP